MDSLRYLVTRCHVDGFRFDLASALAREFHEVDRLSAFFDIIHQDPVLSQVKLIAEPWDVGEGGYQVGNFPVLWTEWNGIYRDVVRDFWRGEARVGDFAYRFTGSADLYERDGRRPSASINFVTAHDGFTLADLVSYNEKHNEANLEDNRDGTDDNRSWNCGVEGPTDDPEVIALRERQMRNFLATLFLSQGVPMLLAGDELAPHAARQQQRLLPGQRALLGRLGARRADGAAARVHAAADRAAAASTRCSAARRFLAGDGGTAGCPDVWWFRPDGRKMTRRDWEGADGPRLGVFLNGDELGTRDAAGRAGRRRLVPVLFNAAPRARRPSRCRRAASAAAGSSSSRPPIRTPERPSFGRAATVALEARSLVVLRRDVSARDLRATYRLQLGPA